MRVFTEQGHITDDSLALHILNDLPQAQGDHVEQHLRECPVCRDRFSETNDFLALFRALAQAQTGRSGLNCCVGAIRMRPRVPVHGSVPAAQ